MAASYYDSLDLTHIPELVKRAPEVSAAFFAFEKEVYREDSRLPLKTKELIAIAVAHVTGCPYCIDVHVRRFKEQGGSMEELIEALMVAASTRAGAVLSHGTQAWKAFGKDNEQAGEPKASKGPECFC